MFSSTVACGEKSAWCPLVVNSIGSSYPVPLTIVNCFVVVVHAGLNTATISVRNVLSYKFNIVCKHKQWMWIPGVLFSPHPPHLVTRLAGMLAQSPLEGSRNVNLLAALDQRLDHFAVYMQG